MRQWHDIKLTMNSPLKGSLGGIKIKPSHKGLLHKNLGVTAGKKLTVAQEEKTKNSSDPAERKRATFALNARKWAK